MSNENKKLNKFLSINQRPYHIIAVDQYGENILGKFFEKSEKTYGFISDSVNIILKDEIESYLNINKEEFLFVIGDMNEPRTAEIVKRIINKEEKRLYLVLKDLKDINISNRVSLINIDDENDIYYSLESLLYWILYPYLGAIDLYDMWELFKNSKVKVKRFELKNLEKELKEGEIKNYKNIHIEILGNINMQLHDVNEIMETIQKYANNEVNLISHIVFNKEKQDIVKINLLYIKK